eukprot:gnl/Carplike_NY0171/9512_a13285_155.p1 GENE.gnl/Carplike_NY0171/9512_a13285_155~~gnl/Carplike_NY0171/9512_a13285_155.p1  ORF type:complete len:359 (-),score=130.47 gnl/Carplike_NY0171/9512_a13285_155:85-1125(-)
MFATSQSSSSSDAEFTKDEEKILADSLGKPSNHHPDHGGDASIQPSLDLSHPLRAVESVSSSASSSSSTATSTMEVKDMQEKVDTDKNVEPIIASTMAVKDKELTEESLDKSFHITIEEALGNDEIVDASLEKYESSSSSPRIAEPRTTTHVTKDEEESKEDVKNMKDLSDTGDLASTRNATKDEEEEDATAPPHSVAVTVPSIAAAGEKEAFMSVHEDMQKHLSLAQPSSSEQLLPATLLSPPLLPIALDVIHSMVSSVEECGDLPRLVLCINNAEILSDYELKLIKELNTGRVHFLIICSDFHHVGRIQEVFGDVATIDVKPFFTTSRKKSQISLETARKILNM